MATGQATLGTSGSAGDLVDDEPRSGVLGRPAPPTLVGDDRAVDHQLATPHAPRLAPVEGPAQARPAHGAHRADGSGAGELDEVLGEEQVGQRRAGVGAPGLAVDLDVERRAWRDRRETGWPRRPAVRVGRPVTARSTIRATARRPDRAQLGRVGAQERERHVAVTVVAPSAGGPAAADDDVAAAGERGVAAVADEDHGVAVDEVAALAVRWRDLHRVDAEDLRRRRRVARRPPAVTGDRTTGIEGAEHRLELRLVGAAAAIERLDRLGRRRRAVPPTTDRR